MVEVTIAVASAWIAAGIAVFQFILPNALALVLTSLLSDEQPAVTWSVVSRFFLSSDWPLFLRSEAATATGVPRKISLVAWTKPVGLFLIAVAAIVTPLGLFDEIGPATVASIVEFRYVADSSLIGAGTPPRSQRGFNYSRTCSSYLCPGDIDKGNITLAIGSDYKPTKFDQFYIIPESINPDLIDFHQRGTSDTVPSLSNLFDIQARQWKMWTDPKVENNGSLLSPAYRYLSPLLMDGKLELVEGLIVDLEKGGIGFRNHSVPVTSSQHGVEWEEDILWWQPETICVDTNLTLSLNSSSETQSLLGHPFPDVVDRGGFCNLQKVDPCYTPPNTTREYPFIDGQANPYLYERAFFLAWYHNAFAMEYLSITDPMTNLSRVSSSMNQHFPVNGTLDPISSDSIDFSPLNRGGDLIEFPTTCNESWNDNLGYCVGDNNPMIPNPYNVTLMALDYHYDYCLRGLISNTVNISNLDVSSGFMAGPAARVNESDLNNATSPDTWEMPYYTCASATRMLVKSIRFRYNSTKDLTLDNLEIMMSKIRVIPATRTSRCGGLRHHGGMRQQRGISPELNRSGV